MRKLTYMLTVLLCLCALCGCQQGQTDDAYGLDFTEAEVQAAVETAKTYYEDELISLHDQVAQGIDISYDKAKAHDHIMATSVKQDIEKNGPGTVIILQVTIPSLPENDPQRQRVIELNRDNDQSDWLVRTEGPL